VSRKEGLRDLPDERLIEKIRAGEVGAFEWIVERYESLVANIIFGILGNVHNADDLGQDVFLRTYKGLGSFRFKAAFRTYLTRIAINVCVDEMKKRDRKTLLIEGYLPYPDLPCEDEEAQFDLKDLVQAALLQLDKKQRIVVVLRLMEGYSTRETASILKIPEGTVLSRLSRGQKKLKEILLGEHSAAGIHHESKIKKESTL
jgi:RNA polymerase sigma-70 factor (ECF subfamily)